LQPSYGVFLVFPNLGLKSSSLARVRLLPFENAPILRLLLLLCGIFLLHRNLPVRKVPTKQKHARVYRIIKDSSTLISSSHRSGSDCV